MGVSRKRRSEGTFTASPKGQAKRVTFANAYAACPEGKIVHTKATARRHMKNLRGEGGKTVHANLVVYKCLHGDHYHVGHRRTS